MSKPGRNLTLDILAGLLLYATVIIYQGYQYGQSDQSQILPVLHALDHPGSYTHDQYVNAYLQSSINERTIFQFILHYSGYNIPFLVFLWHALFSIALIAAWIRIAALFITNKTLQFLSVACILIIGFHTSVGSNEIYYNQFIPSLPAKAIGSWAIYYWLKNRHGTWVALLILSSFMQPLVGFQLFMLTALAQLIMFLKDRRREKFVWPLMILFLIVILPWIFMLAINNGGHENPGDFMDIMEFRLSHHFFASYFGVFHLIVFIVLSALCILLFKGKLKWFVLLTLTGCVVYEIGVEVFRLPLFLYTQWWKTTIWIEAFGFIALIRFLESGFFLKEKFKAYPLAIPVMLVLIFAAYRFSGLSGHHIQYMAPFPQKPSDEVGISIQAKQLTSDDAVFIIPPDLTSFRWYSKRSTFIDHKALFHQEDFLLEWYKRIKEVYQYDLAQKKSGITFHQKANEMLTNPGEAITRWKGMGITHIISPHPGLKSLTLIGHNSSYAIYKL